LSARPGEPLLTYETREALERAFAPTDTEWDEKARAFKKTPEHI
jgi:hypothetical protein